MPTPTTIVSRFKATLVSKIFAAVAGGLLMVFLARELSSNEYGLLFFAISVVSVGTYFSKLGFGESAARYIAQYKTDEQSQIYHIIRYSSVLLLLSSSIVAVLFGVFNSQMAALLNEPDIAPFLLIAVIYIPVASFFQYTTSVLQGFEKIHLSAIGSILFTLFEVTTVVILVVLGFGAVGAFWGYTAGYFVALMATTGMVLYIVYPLYQQRQTPEDDLLKRIFEYNLSLSATKGGSLLDKEVDTVLVGFFAGPVAVSFYVIGKQLTEFVKAPADALGYTLAPSYGSAKSSGDLTQASRTYEQAIIYTLLLYIPAAAGIVIVADPLINYVFGPEYGGAIVVIQLFSFYVILRGVMENTSTGLDFLGRARSRAIAKGITSVGNVLLNLLLIPLFGVVGAVVATLITYSVYTMLNLYIISTEMDLHAKTIYSKLFLISIVTLIMSAIVLYLRQYVTGLITLIGAILIGVGVWAVVSIALGLIDYKKATQLLG